VRLGIGSACEIQSDKATPRWCSGEFCSNRTETCSARA